MIDAGMKVRVKPTHRFNGAAGVVAEMRSEHDNGDPRANPFRVELARPTSSGVRSIWLSAADLVVVP